MKTIHHFLLASLLSLSACSFSFSSGPATGSYPGSMAMIHGPGKPARRADDPPPQVAERPGKPAKPEPARVEPAKVEPTPAPVEPAKKPTRVGRKDPPQIQLVPLPAEPEPQISLVPSAVPKPAPQIRLVDTPIQPVPKIRPVAKLPPTRPVG